MALKRFVPPAQRSRSWPCLARRSLVVFTVVVVLIQANLWLGYFVRPERSHISATLVADDSTSIAFNVLLLVGAVLWRLPVSYLVVLLLSTFSQLVTDFSVFYVSLGTRANFNMPLSRLDALYFTIGTLTTSGTGDIVATSEAVRRIQMFQMVLDFLLVVVAVTLVLSSLLTPRTSERGSAEQPS